MRKVSKASKQTLEASSSAEQLEILSDLPALFVESNPISENMAEEKTLREHAGPQVNQASLSIATPTLQVPLELKSGLIHLVPFSLDVAAKEWLFYLPARSITSWEGMMRIFLDRYFPSSRVINVRRDICGIKQKVTETLFEYWERFKKLCASCPQHDIPEQSPLHYFYEVELHQQENLGIVLSENNCLKNPKESSNTSKKSENLVHELESMNPKFGNSLAHDSPSSHTKVFPSLVQDPELKLKTS
ncbi:DNA-directed DNA polymerase [Senna tora]|uniref:DNA-directed DNA polymerase n=1 Tax=Senna tora TaxID=362788 RepID=A0A834WUJ7_9FABA|nr:DNA-directed DNA polymerase [Senna tora]